MLFLRLKHRHLYNIPLTNFDALCRGVDFYLNDSNTRMPHPVLHGATPEEIMTNAWTEAEISDMKARAVAARKRRLVDNLSLRCQPCLA